MPIINTDNIKFSVLGQITFFPSLPEVSTGAVALLDWSQFKVYRNLNFVAIWVLSQNELCKNKMLLLNLSLVALCILSQIKWSEFEFCCNLSLVKVTFVTFHVLSWLQFCHNLIHNNLSFVTIWVYHNLNFTKKNLMFDTVWVLSQSESCLK